ncbi:MAG: pilus assembly protein PilM [Phycisphaerae bacterium]|nr:pilus assembly protein PilM [Phycisphaerae bacterium]
MLKRRAEHGPIGLDVGAAGIKMVQFSRDGEELGLLAAAHCEIPPSMSGSSERSAAIEQAVRDALRQYPFQGRRVVTALGSGEFQLKNIRLPRMPSEEMASAIEFEARDRFGMDEGGAQFRHMTAGEVRHGNELKKEIIVFASPDEVVDARLKMLESLKLNPVALDIAPCAVARCFFRFLRRMEDAQSVNVFLDVGWRGTSIVLAHGTDVSFLKMIDVGGQHLNESVAKALSISRKEAAALRVRIVRETSGRRTGDKSAVPEEVCATVGDAVRPVIERVARDVQLCLRYYAVTFRGQKPRSLTLVGGEAHEPSLMQIIAEGIDVPCTIGNPLMGVSRIGRLGAREERAFQPAWAVACGLALRGVAWSEQRDAHPVSLADYRTATAGM